MPTGNERHYCYWHRCTSRGPYADSKTLFEHVDDTHNVQPNKGVKFFCKWEECRCKRAISGKKHRTDHLITHTGYRPMVCTAAGCGANFSTEHSMNAHLTAHHAAARSKTASLSMSPASKNGRAKRASGSGGRNRPATKRRRLTDGNDAASESDCETATSTPAALSTRGEGAADDYGTVGERNNLQLRKRLRDAEENMKRMQTQLDVLLYERASGSYVQQTPRSASVGLEHTAAAVYSGEVQAREAWEVDASDARSGCVIA